MTEEQARKYTCPYLRAPCQASSCMAWRFDVVMEGNWGWLPGPPPPTKRSATDGHCKLIDRGIG